MPRPVLLVTGCDANFYPYMCESLASLEALGLLAEADTGILDMGLKPDQVVALEARGFTVRQCRWELDVPEELRKSFHIGYQARAFLPQLFPGHEVYLWFDADAWAQTREFFDVLVAGARREGAAVIRENGSGYYRDFIYNKWWYGHMLMSFGPLGGLQVAFLPAINTGILALRVNAPHWAVWQQRYQHMINHRRKLNMDQHSFNAAVVLNRLPHLQAPPSCNWICTLSPPHWNPQTRKFCTPDSAAHPLSVLHLAGPDKRRIYQLQQTEGGRIATPVTFEAYQALSA